MKLAVGVRDLAHLLDLQTWRTTSDPPLRHQTRMRPTRGAELLAGGSIYWVVAGVLQVRQRILDLREEAWDDGRSCTGLILDPVLVAITPRAQRPFQGWRYLAADAAPRDLSATPEATGEAALPPELRGELRRLGLL